MGSVRSVQCGPTLPTVEKPEMAGLLRPSKEAADVTPLTDWEGLLSKGHCGARSLLLSGG